MGFCRSVGNVVDNVQPAQVHKAHRPPCASRFQECFPVLGPSVVVSDLNEGRAGE
jgi:hypothetical protein